MIKILPINNFEIKQYDALASKFGTLFNTSAWLVNFENKIKYYGIYKNDIMIGGFSMYLDKQYFLKIYRNPPFTPGIGPFIRIDSYNSVAIMSIWKNVLAAIAEYFEEIPYSIISLPLNRNIIDTQPFIWNNFKVVPRYTYIINLTKTISEIMKNMSPERRNDIRKAERDKLNAVFTTDYKIVKKIVCLTLVRNNINFSEKVLDNILFQYSTSNNSFAYVTYKDDIPIAVAFNLFDGESNYYLLGGFDEKHKHHGAGALAIISSIKMAKTLNINKFDFEGSMIPHIESYFRGFGGILTPYFQINKAKIALEMLLKIKMRDKF